LPVIVEALVFKLTKRRVWLATAATGVVVLALVASWTVPHGRRMHRLRLGVGDTVFHSADGGPWFSMDDRRQDVRLADISPHLRRAVIAVEDRRFFSHYGIDLFAISRAAVHNARQLKAVEGASTITQQLARTLFLSNRRTITRKLQEAVLALMLEAELSKDQILELYLNRVYFGAGLYGAEKISDALFGKRARDLTLAEAALVAALIRAPSALSPWSNPDGAMRRSQLVLATMREQGVIDAETERAAVQTRLRLQARPASKVEAEGYAREFLRQQFEESFGGDNRPDWQVHTTFVRALQTIAERAVSAGLRQAARPGLQAALVALNPQTGDVLALVGGRDFRSSPFDRATRGRRQAGSAFKPFVYAAALEHGWSPVSVLSGLSRLRVEGPDEWVPQNAHNERPDQLTLREALFESNNRAAVALQRQIGSRMILDQAATVGLRDLPDVPSLALGVGVVSPLELTAAYAVFPNGGFRVVPRAVVRVVDDSGAVLETRGVDRTRVLSAASAFQMVMMLQDVLDRGTATGARARGVRFPAGGKTGTTDDFKDAWFVGFSSSIVAGVWVGFDQPAPIGPDGYGARYALPIWSEFMRDAAGVWAPAAFAVPEGVRETRLCQVSHLRAAEGCPAYTEYFKDSDARPASVCSIHGGPQDAGRRVERFFASLGRRVASLFKR
jgi:1A family penicillin-binding protein